MEKLKVKHDHTLTDILKVCMFGLFLILPILCFLPSGLYYGFNEHATNEASTEIQYKYQSNEVNSVDDLVDGNIYFAERLMINDESIESDGDHYFYLSIYKYDNLDLTIGDFQPYYEDEYDFQLENYTANGNSCVYIHYLFSSSNQGADVSYVYTIGLKSDDTYIILTEESGYPLFENVYFTFENETTNAFQNFVSGSINTGDVSLPIISDYNVIESVTTNTNNTISSNMYRSWSELWQTPLFSWTGNQNFQTTINAFTSVFAISQQSYITNYLTYVLTLTAIYVIIDIVLSMFKLVTHLFNAK